MKRYCISMPPIRKKRRPVAFVVPYHRFLGPGTDIEDKRYLPPLNKLDWAAKRHDFNYGNKSISTEEADEQFYKDSEGTGLLGAASRTALKLKSALGFDSTFRSSTAVDTLGVNTGNSTAQTMDQSASTVEDTDSGQSNGWQGTSHGGALPPESGNEFRSYCVKRRFKNIVKTTDMNSVKGHFTKYKGSESTGYHNVGHFAWAEPESADYIVPYFMSTWVTPIKWEAMMGQATSYRVKSTGFTIDKIICGELLTKNNEEFFVPNPEPYFDVFVDRGSYIGYGNLKGITKIPNKNFTEIQPMTGVDAELPKYKYDYGMPIHLLNKMGNSGDITATNLETDVLMTHLHDWREMPEVKHVRQGDTYTHVWHNHSLLRKPLTNMMSQGNYTVQGAMLSTATVMESEITNGNTTAWDSGLCISTAPDIGTLIERAEMDIAFNQRRKRMRKEKQEDLCMVEVADIAFDHQRARKVNASKTATPTLPGQQASEQSSGSMTVSNRTLINKVLYTNEDAPEMVLIHVPPILL